MKRLTPPIASVHDAVEACASGISDAGRATTLREALPVLVSAEHEYKNLGAVGSLYRFVEAATVTAALDGELMGVIYKRHFARAGSPSRPIYDAIRMRPLHGICPLCGQRMVSTVDHYLPQTKHPKLALTPINLVPSCADCNKRKLARTPGNARDQTLHPYFDDLGSERWLVVDVGEYSPPSLVFRIRPSPAWSADLAARVLGHFELMGLDELYAAQAASEVADISYALREVGEAGGPQSVRDHLSREFRSRHARDPNSWQTALYEGLSESQWFCNQGYQTIRV